MIEFDLTALYPLLEAFDRTGRRMYGNAWRGIEAFARRADDPKATKAERAEIVARITELSVEAVPHNTVLSLDVSQEEFQAASGALAPLYIEERALKEKLTTIPHVTDYWVKDFEAYSRRRKVENELRAAFEKDELKLHLGHSELANVRSWSGHADFRIYFGFSMVRIPFRLNDRQRRSPAFVKKAEFDSWLDRFGPAYNSEAKLTPEARLKAWLQEMVNKNKPKERTKDDYLAQAQAEIPNLSARSFTRVWAVTVPEIWKEKGRPKLDQ